MDLKRGFSTAQLTELQSVFHPGLLVHLDWPDVPIFVHSGKGTINWNGENWLGAMDYGSVEIPADGDGGVPEETVLTVAVPPDELDAVMTADVLNRQGEIYAYLATERSGNILIGEPIIVFSGFMKGLVEQVEGSDGNLITVVRIFLGAGPGMRAAATAVHSEEDQTRTHPADTIGRLLINGPSRMQRVVW